jgi:3-hydroxyisobutyrate dehydrogenase
MSQANEHETLPTDEPVGFIGLGVMGQPMARNLAAAGTKLVVWNRSVERAGPLREAGAAVANAVHEVFSSARIIFLMLVNESATDEVLRRGTAAFAELVAGHTVISMGSTAPSYSRELGADIHRAGGRYIECPVSGSRKPAEAGQLVGLLGGDAAAAEEIRPLLRSMCRHVVDCGPAGHAMMMKLAINLHLNTMLAGLAEAVNFARRQGLDVSRLRDAISAGPLACDVSRVKLPKFVERNFEVQAATADALHSCRLIAAAARDAGIATPLLDLSADLYAESVDAGNGRLDMISVIEALEARSSSAAVSQRQLR